MSKTLKINYQPACRDRRMGLVAVLLIVLAALMSMCGLLHADDEKDSSSKSERRERRAENQSNKGKGSADDKSSSRSVTTPEPKKNSERSENPQLPSLPAGGKPTFTPVFSQTHSARGHGSSLQVTAEKEGASSHSSRVLKGKSTLPSDPSNTDVIRRLRREQSLPDRQPDLDASFLKRNPPTIVGSEKFTDSKKIKTEQQNRGDRNKDVDQSRNSGLGKEFGKSPHFSSGKSQENFPGSRIPPRITPEHNQGRLHLDKVPTAPKPDLKVIVSKDASDSKDSPVSRKGPASKGAPSSKDLQGEAHKQIIVDRKSGDRVKIDLDEKLKLTSEQRRLISSQHHLDLKPNRNLKHDISRLPIEKNGRILEANLKQLNLQPRKQPEFQTLLQRGELLQLTSGRHARQMQLHRQFQMFQQGDVARRMNLSKNMHRTGGWQHRKMGVVSAAYSTNSLSCWYPGPSYYPSYCWYPVWSPWVDWCSWDYCDPWCDPRSIYCQPIIWDPSPTWVWWECPTWQPLPVVTCGTWVDIPVVTTPDTDLQMLAVRFVDPGHIQQERGPRYRVWFRNNSQYSIETGFNVMVISSDDPELMLNRNEAGVRVDRIEPGQIMSVDLRLPEEVNYSSLDELGNPVPFQYLTVQIDSHQELVDSFLLNNGVTLPRGDVLPIDPASFAADPLGTTSGAYVNIAGEGFGPEPGQVYLEIAGVELQGEIEGWYDLGVRIRLPEISLTSSVMANVVVIRGDGAAANPLAIEIAPMDSFVSY